MGGLDLRPTRCLPVPSLKGGKAASGNGITLSRRIGSRLFNFIQGLEMNQSGIVAFVLGLVGMLFFMQLMAAADREGWGGAPASSEPEQRPTIH